MNFKKHMLALGIILLLPASAQAETVVVVVNGEQAFQESLPGKELEAKIKRKQAALAAPLEKSDKELQTLQKEFIAQKNDFEKKVKDFQEKESKLLSQESKDLKAEEFRKTHEALEEKQITLQQKYKRFQETVQQLEQKMSDFSQKEALAFHEQFQLAVKNVSKREHWDVVLPQGSYLYADEKLNKTHLITKELNKMHEESNKDKAPKSDAKSPEALKAVKKAA